MLSPQVSRRAALLMRSHEAISKGFSMKPRSLRAPLKYPMSQSVRRRGMAVSTQIGDIFTPTEEHQSLREMVRQFAWNDVEPQALEYNEREEFNLPLFRQLGDLGLLGMTVSEEYGGSGMDATAVTIAHEELSAVDPAFCLSYLAHSLLFANNLYFNGNHEQRQKYLPGACSGELIGGMCMSEPASGTDVLAMKTNAKKEGDHYILNGQKMWITNGSVNDTDLGDVFLVYARTAEGYVCNTFS